MLGLLLCLAGSTSLRLCQAKRHKASEHLFKGISKARRLLACRFDPRDLAETIEKYEKGNKTYQERWTADCVQALIYEELLDMRVWSEGIIPRPLGCDYDRCMQTCGQIGDGSLCDAIQDGACSYMQRYWEPVAFAKTCEDSTGLFCGPTGMTCEYIRDHPNPRTKCFQDQCDAICKQHRFSWCGLSTGAIVGIAISCVVLVGAIVGVCVYYRLGKSSWKKQEEAT
jgi:hypothetical protein